MTTHKQFMNYVTTLNTQCQVCNSCFIFFLGNHLFLDVDLHTPGLCSPAHTMSGECQIQLVSFHTNYAILRMYCHLLISGQGIGDFKLSQEGF